MAIKKEDQLCVVLHNYNLMNSVDLHEKEMNFDDCEGDEMSVRYALWGSPAEYLECWIYHKR